jgi:hypothetical protein
MKQILNTIFTLLFTIALKAGLTDNLHASNADIQTLINHVEQCITNAELGISKINSDILGISGMSSAKVRHFLNNLCSMPGTTYLEIGCWHGSTFVSALYGNSNSVISAVGIDNWTEFDGPKESFKRNIDRFLSDIPLKFIESDCFKIRKSKIFDHPINIYFYDGNHREISQEMAFTFFHNVLDTVFIAVVDDWNLQEVQRGTRSAFRKKGYKIIHERELFTPQNCDDSSWWNGLYIAVIQKAQPH